MEHTFTNHLINETSPYLLQHAHNPVDWYPWGQEALDKALRENKLLIISIGYAACHWCHVMEHESFEDNEVAELMNEKFVCIKVDREERPDIDQVYMNVVQVLTGGGGWPLNCIALPDVKPIYGGTYYPKYNWLEVLEQVAKWVEENPQLASERAEQITQRIKTSELIIANNEESQFTINDLNSIFDIWKNDIDFIDGGNKQVPKFPLPVGAQFLLQYNFLTNNPAALNAVLITLNKMANGGIYDQIGGGFARYSTDKYWFLPHFEKMLYDNAQLVSLYSTAFQLTKDINYKTVVAETLDFVQRELTSAEGGFYSSLDADSEGEEGKFYVWTKKEIQSALGFISDTILDYYNVTESGNWEALKNILFKKNTDAEFSESKNITADDLVVMVLEAKKVLIKERSKRIRPATDDKILTSWNALMLKSYVDAYRVFDNNQYLEIALKNAEFLDTKLKTNDNKLHRNYTNGKASINGFLDDYAFTIAAYIALYQATFDENWLLKAEQLAEYSITHFFDSRSGMFYYTSDDDPDLIARNIDINDNVIPSANSEMAKNLFILGKYFYNDEYIQKAKTMLNNVKQQALQYGAYYANWSILMSWFAAEPFDVSIAGKDCDNIRKEFDKHYLSNVIISGAKKESGLDLFTGKFTAGKTMIYICQGKSCHQATENFDEALKQIK
ncbi:MAG: thioredoxin domain-containing protein [bacterium]